MEQISNDKSANQLWKESSTTLSFKDWIEREKQKGMLIPNKLVSDSLALVKIKAGIQNNEDKVISSESNSNTVLGLNKLVLISSVLIIFGALGYSIYKKRK
jgi:hypothetical protein